MGLGNTKKIHILPIQLGSLLVEVYSHDTVLLELSWNPHLLILSCCRVSLKTLPGLHWWRISLPRMLLTLCTVLISAVSKSAVLEHLSTAGILQKYLFNEKIKYVTLKKLYFIHAQFTRRILQIGLKKNILCCDRFEKCDVNLFPMENRILWMK